MLPFVVVAATAAVVAAAAARPPAMPMVSIPAGETLVGTSTATPIAGHCRGEPCPALCLQDPYCSIGTPYGDYDEHPQRTAVSVPAFHLAATEVTNAQYEKFDPDHRIFRGLEHGWSTGDHEPAVFVSHENATAYCVWLSAQHPGTRYRLPTEVEWERAARAGSATNFWYGDVYNLSEAKQGASVKDRPNLTVAQFRPNPFGLFDTVGNVEEWTATAYGPYPGAHAADFSPGLFVTRGGSLNTDPFYLRSANRGAAVPAEMSAVVGFRVAASSGFATASTQGAMAQLPPAPLALPRTAAPVVAATAEPRFFGPFEYVHFDGRRYSDNGTSGGPLFSQHNHAPSMGIGPDGSSLVVAWFSTVSEGGRNVAYAYSTMDVGTMASTGRAPSTEGQLPNYTWPEAKLLYKAADRGQQTQLFHTDRTTGKLTWYASMAVTGGIGDDTVIRREFSPRTINSAGRAGEGGGWGAAEIVTTRPVRCPPHLAWCGGNLTTIASCPAHADGPSSIPFAFFLFLTNITTCYAYRAEAALISYQDYHMSHSRRPPPL